MQSIKVEAHNIKNIDLCDIEIDFEKGVYAFVGGNGCGKSTLMNLLALLVRPSVLKKLSNTDYSDDSYIKLSIEDNTDILLVENGSWTTQEKQNGRQHMNNHYRGFF